MKKKVLVRRNSFLKVPTAEYILSSICILLAMSCVSNDENEEEGITKEEAQATDKADWPFDWCEFMGWYHDNNCDTFCPNPDPECEPCADKKCRDLCWTKDGEPGECRDSGECLPGSPESCVDDPPCYFKGCREPCIDENGNTGYCNIVDDSLILQCLPDEPEWCPDDTTILSEPPLGTYIEDDNLGTPNPDVTRFAFLADGRFHIDYRNGSTLDGTYEFTGAPENMQVLLYDSSGSLNMTLDIQHYNSSNNIFIDIRISGGEWMTLLHWWLGWCENPDDCGVIQGELMPAYCMPGGWDCLDNMCSLICDR